MGAVLDAGTGLSLLGARYYDAVIGRFISVDPQLNPGNPAQFNAYDYSGNNPLTWSDPSGLDFLSFLSDVGKNLTKAANNVGDFIYTYKAEIVGAIVGVAVTGLCLAATAGAGSIACVVAGAAAGGAVSGAMSAAVTAASTGQLFTPQGMLSVATGYFVGGIVGAATGVLGGVVGAVLGKGISAAASTAVGGAIKSFIGTITSKFKPKPPATAAPPPPGTWSTAAESMSPRASAYQAQITGQPSGTVYTVNNVKFDGFANGVLQEAKGPGYATFVSNGEFRSWFNGAASLVSQAERQLVAAGGTPITWSVAESQAVTAIKNLFSSKGIVGIDILHVPAG